MRVEDLGEMANALSEKLSNLPKWIYLGSLSSICVYYYVNNKWSYWSRRGISGPPPEWTGMGHSLKMFNVINDSPFEKWEAEHGKQFGLYLGLDPVLFVTDIDLIRQVSMNFCKS